MASLLPVAPWDPNIEFSDNPVGRLVQSVLSGVGLATPREAGSPADAIKETLGTPGGESLGGLGTDSGAGDPANAEMRLKFLKTYGYDDDTANMVVTTYSDNEQEEIFRKLLEGGPPSGNKTAIDREKLAAQFPEYAEIIRSAPEGALTNIISKLVGEKDKTASGSKVDREAAKRALPDIAPFIDGMSDSAVSAAMADAFEGAQTAGPDGIQYRERKGAPKLNIVQDAAFQRSGLKSGDTVCIRIP